MPEETHQKSSQHGSALLGFIIIIATALQLLYTFSSLLEPYE